LLTIFANGWTEINKRHSLSVAYYKKARNPRYGNTGGFVLSLNNSDIFMRFRTIIITQTAEISSDFYIIPIPPPPAGIGGTGSLMDATTDSVVSSVDATLVAF